MRSREQLEDAIQRLVCELLPKLPPQDIRPAYQQQDNAGKDILQDNLEHLYTGFTPNDNFAYITVNIGTQDILTSVDEAGNVSTGYPVTATFTFYGNQSAQLALCLFNLIDIPYSLEYLESEDLHLTSKDSNIDEMHEIVNEQWFERHEFSIKLTQPDVIKSPKVVKPAIKDSVKVSVIVNESDKVVSTSEVTNVD